MWTTGAGWSIWRLDRSTKTWTDTGVRNDARPKPSYLYRYSGANGTHTLDQGFPSTINTSSSETLTIDEDSTGAIWATWVQVTGGGATPTAAVLALDE